MAHVQAQPEADKTAQVVVTGAYRCSPPSLQHSIRFTATDLGEVFIHSLHGNLDAGDCIPRGMQARTLAAEGLSCTVGPFISALITEGGAIQPGSMFGFVCGGTKAHVVNAIHELSQEILRPTE
jgi:hypothetical protein